MTTLILVLLLVAPAVDDMPEIQLDHPDVPSVTLGEQFRFTVEILPGRYASRAWDAILLGLELENLRVVSIRSSTEQLHTSASTGNKQTFQVVLEPIEAGNAMVGELQAEFSVPDLERPILLTYPGFTIEVIPAGGWETLIPWIALALVIVVTGVLATLLVRRKKARLDSRQESSPEKHRRDILANLDALRIRAEFTRMVEIAFPELIHETVESTVHTADMARLDRAIIDEISKQWPNFSAAYRLGEEVRYGGYKPTRAEAGFMVKVLRDIYVSKSDSSRNEFEEQV